jgi:hypothetical protein
MTNDIFHSASRILSQLQVAVDRDGRITHHTRAWAIEQIVALATPEPADADLTLIRGDFGKRRRGLMAVVGKGVQG